MRTILIAAAACLSALAVLAVSAHAQAPLPQFPHAPGAEPPSLITVSLARAPGGAAVVSSVLDSRRTAHLRAPADGEYWLSVTSGLGPQSAVQVMTLEVRLLLEGGGQADLPVCSDCATAADPLGLTLAEGEVAQVRVEAIVVTGRRTPRPETSPFRPLG